MEILVIIGLVIVAAAMFYMSSKNPSKPTSDILPILDANKDGKVDIKDAVAAAEVVVEKTKKTAAKAKTVAKATAAKAKTAVKKTTAKKTKAK